MDDDVANGWRYDFFIAHSGDDLQVARTLWALLDATNKTFLASQSLTPGQRWDVRIPEAQSKSRITVALITRNTDQAFYQRDEIAYAVELHRRDGGHRFVPVFLDGDPDVALLPYGVRAIHGLVVPKQGGLRGVASELIGILDTLPSAEDKKRVDLAAQLRARDLHAASEVARETDPYTALQLALDAYALTRDRSSHAFLEQAHRRMSMPILPPVGASDLRGGYGGPKFSPDRQGCLYEYRQGNLYEDRSRDEGIVVSRGRSVVRQIRGVGFLSSREEPWSPDGELFCVRDSAADAVHIHDRNGARVATLEKKGLLSRFRLTPEFHAHNWSPTSDRIVTRPGMRGALTLWDTQGKALATISAPRREFRKYPPPTPSWAPNGALFALDYYHAVHMVWSRDGERLAAFEAFVHFSADGRFACHEQEGCRFYSERAELLGELQGSLLPDGWNPVRNCGLFRPRRTENTVLVDTDGRVLRQIYDTRLDWAQWSGRGDRIMACDGTSLTVMDLDRDRLIARRDSGGVRRHQIRWAPDGQSVVIFHPRSVELWDANLKLVATIPVEREVVLQSATWTRDGSAVLVKANDTQWFVLDRSGEVITDVRSGPNRSDDVQDVEWGPDDACLLLIGYEWVKTAPLSSATLVETCEDLLRRNRVVP